METLRQLNLNIYLFLAQLGVSTGDATLYPPMITVLSSTHPWTHARNLQGYGTS